jgi:hypothetical protein
MVTTGSARGRAVFVDVSPFVGATRLRHVIERRLPCVGPLAPNYCPASLATTGANVSAKSAPTTK